LPRLLPEPQSQGVLLDRIVAVANEGIVTEGELRENMSEYAAQMKQRGTPLPDTEVLRSKVLDLLITQQLQLQRAEERDIKISDEQINQAIREWAASEGHDYASLPELMEDYAAFRENMRKTLLIEEVTMREVYPRIYVSEREIEQHIAQMKRLPDENAEYDISDILLALPGEATQAQVDAVAAKAQEVYELAATEDFAALAARFSDAAIGLDGGGLGWLKGAELPSWAVDAIPGMKPGEVSRPIASTWGYHVARLNGVRHGDSAEHDQVHVRRMLLKTSPLQDDATVELRLNGYRQRALDGEDFGAIASGYSQESETQGDGGDLGWLRPEEFRSQKMAEVVAGLKDNEISAPFQTDSGWYIVQLLGRRRIDMTEVDLRNRARSQLYNSKGLEEEQLWVRELRDQAYIKTDL
jgi:peptidyl-prolyl cis-trans isomerase SurA